MCSKQEKEIKGIKKKVKEEKPKVNVVFVGQTIKGKTYTLVFLFKNDKIALDWSLVSLPENSVGSLFENEANKIVEFLGFQKFV